jgi:hypothetical protein
MDLVRHYVLPPSPCHEKEKGGEAPLMGTLLSGHIISELLFGQLKTHQQFKAGPLQCRPYFRI